MALGVATVAHGTMAAQQGLAVAAALLLGYGLCTCVAGAELHFYYSLSPNKISSGIAAKIHVRFYAHVS